MVSKKRQFDTEKAHNNDQQVKDSHKTMSSSKDLYRNPQVFYIVNMAIKIMQTMKWLISEMGNTIK